MKKIMYVLMICISILSFAGCISEHENVSVPTYPQISDVASCEESSIGVMSQDESFCNIPCSDVCSTNMKYLYDCFGVLTVNDIFLQTMYDNPIDRYVTQRLSEAYTTREIIFAVADKYTLWSAEMENAVELFAAVLDDNERLEFERIQAQWLENINSEYSFSADLFGRGGFMPSQLSYSILDAKAESVKLRTIRIKYLHYILESETTAPIEEYCSLKFLEFDLN